MGKAQASCYGCGNGSWSRGLFDKIQGRETKVMRKLFHFSREEDETLEALVLLEIKLLFVCAVIAENIWRRRTSRGGRPVHKHH